MERAVRNLPVMIKREFANMNEFEQAEFMEEFRRKRKSVGKAYLASLLSLHYAYVGRFGMTFVMWIVGVLTLGIGVLIWWTIDLFRIPGIVRDKNSDIGVAVLRDQRIISRDGSR